MDEQIKPVAWMLDTDSCTSLSAPLAQANRGGSHTEPLYPQQSIDALRAEVKLARDGWHMANGVADLAMKHRDAAESRAERAEAEAEALRADAERYRWLRDLPDDSPHECIGNMPGDMWDEAIDAARKGAE